MVSSLASVTFGLPSEPEESISKGSTGKEMLQGYLKAAQTVDADPPVGQGFCLLGDDAPLCRQVRAI